MNLQLRCVSEFALGEKWRESFERFWPTYQIWFLKQGNHARPNYLACERAFKTYMPELMPTYQRLMELTGGGDQVARFLSLYQPTPYLSGCSQAIWTRDNPFLVRNYDYSEKLWEATLLHTAWNGRQVVAMSDCLWGVLDGMNEDGLTVSLAFGGRKVVGDGFGIPIILRYILEFCQTTAEAIAVLRRIPSHMAYNVSVLDLSGTYVTVFVSPDRELTLSHRAFATNHQGSVDWPEHAFATASVDRAHILSLRLSDASETGPRFATRFLEPPLYQSKRQLGWSTLYTAVYNPTSRQSTYRWPEYILNADFEHFIEQTIHLTLQ